MTTFTILNTNQDLNTLPVGTKLLVKTEPTQFSAKALRAYEYGKTEDVGFIGKHKLAEGTDVVDVLYDLMETHDKLSTGIEVVVVDFGEVEMTHSSSSLRKVLIVEVVPSELKSESDDILDEGGVVLNLKMKGSAVKNPKKSDVIKKIMSKELEDDTKAEQFYELFKLSIDSKTNDIVATVATSSSNLSETQLAGTADSSTEDYEMAFKVLSTLEAGDIKFVVKNPANATYEVEMIISEENMHFVRTGERPLSLGELKEQKAELLGVDVERLNRIQDYLEKSGVSKKGIEAIFHSYKKYPEEVQSRIPEPSVQFSDSFGGVKKSVVYLNKKKHLRFVGEKGTGKNLLITTMAWIYQRPLYELSMNAQTDKMDLLGSPTLNAELVDGNVLQKVEFQKQALIEAMEYGGFMNLDEVNTADPAVLVLLHSIVDDRGTIEVPNYGRVQADDNFGMILSMNVDYVGTTPLNEATRDRFTPIVFPENESIAKLLKARVKSAKKEDITLADRVYKEMMKKVQDGRLSMDSITVRGFIDALEVLDELTLEEALTDNVVNRVEDREYRDTVAEIVDKVVG